MISVSFNFCSNDSEFIDEAIKQAAIFSDDIHVSYIDKFFNGEEEDLALIKEHERKNEKLAIFHKLPWESELKTQMNSDYHFFKFCHNICRYTNINASKYPYVIFMDSDLVPEGQKVLEWLRENDLEKFKSYYFMIYSYHRSKTIPTRWDESTVIMSDKRYITGDQIMSIYEIQAFLNSPCRRMVLGLDGKPMFHHYGWARGNNDEECKKRLLRKISSWGHSFDKNWTKIIEDEFSHPYNGPWIP